MFDGPIRSFCSACLFMLLFALTPPGRADAPRVLDPRLELQLFAQEPDIVTPVGLTFDHQGRLLVIESHTHFPPEGYAGPKVDRIRRVEDTDGDGRADQFDSFLEGTEKTMSLRQGPDRWIYVATRMQVFRARDADGDGAADQREVIATLETEGDYPHNGLGGLAFDNVGQLYFGLGENLGASYSLVGRDGTRLDGGGEGGNVYRCQVDGTQLEQVATGFWNPFGICVDSLGRVYTVGNDPDASPPCRLVHVVDGGDYGYQFRYGRSGKHPLQAWDGELPGTLPMIAGTSEAPSGVLLWHGQLYSSSWGEYRLERFTLKSRGASLSADREVIVQGDDQFRPVDLAISPDGSLYFTDWVDRSYNVHGKGRIWRLSWKQTPEQHVIPALNTEATRAAAATQTIDWPALTSSDPFLRHAAMMGLKGSDRLTAAEFSARRHPRQRLGILEAARRSQLASGVRNQLIRLALADSDLDVRVYAVRWIADEQLSEFRGSLDELMNSEDSSVALFKAALAAIEWLELNRDGQPATLRGRVAGERLLVAALEDDTRPVLQIMALKSLSADHPSMHPQRLAALIRNPQLGPSVRREAARSLAVSEMPTARETRVAIVAETEIPADARADVLAGMEGKTEVVADADARPHVSDLDAWLEMLSDTGDADAGWRVFFKRGSARCASCHRLDGRGADVGPDLTGIGRRLDRRRLLQSILQPSQEIGPRYVPWLLQTEDGRSWLGMSLGVFDSGRVERFLGADGNQFELPIREVESRRLSEKSIMPDGLHELLSIQDLQNLLAILSL